MKSKFCIEDKLRFPWYYTTLKLKLFELLNLHNLYAKLVYAIHNIILFLLVYFWVIHVQWIFIHAALVSSRAFIIPSHNKKIFVFWACFSSFFGPSVMPSWALTSMQSVIKNAETPVSIERIMKKSLQEEAQKTKLFLLLWEGIINAREDTSAACINIHCTWITEK